MRARPFVKWVGGKGQLLAQFEKRGLLPQRFGGYYEPFVGGGALYFHLRPERAVINDVNPKLVAAYRTIQGRAEELIAVLAKREREYLALDDAGRKALYYTVRARYNTTPAAQQPECTADLIFLNRTGFNGLYRENLRAEFNVPHGRYRNPTICHAENIRATAAVLSATTILSGPFEAAVAGAEADDLVYFDPPYDPVNATSSFTSYAEGGFGREDQVRLRDLARELADRGCLVLLSNSDTPFIRELYATAPFVVDEVAAARSINAQAVGRGKVSEVVIRTYR